MLVKKGVLPFDHLRFVVEYLCVFSGNTGRLNSELSAVCVFQIGRDQAIIPVTAPDSGGITAERKGIDRVLGVGRVFDLECNDISCF
ncbi:MAG: hypothetical protein Q4C59_08920 [Lachnospiraceae bacterium]|nr:hypothetical protein [Lachnospiraceae bacterium]